jgi:hypothetical protein
MTPPDPDRPFSVSAQDLAPAVHEFYRQLCRQYAWPIPYDVDYAQLPPDLKADNLAAAARIQRALARVGLAVVTKDHPSTLSPEEVRRNIEHSIEDMAEDEHIDWRGQRELEDWSYSPVRDDAAKKHPCLVPYGSLSEEEKEKDRNVVRHYPDIVELAGCKIVKADSPGKADTR